MSEQNINLWEQIPFLIFIDKWCLFFSILNPTILSFITNFNESKF